MTFIFIGKEHISFFKNYENTIISSGFSKHLSLGGWRIGYIVLPKSIDNSVLTTYKAIISETWSSVNSPAQYALADTLENYQDLDKYLNVCKKAHETRMKFLVKKLKEANIIVNNSDGAFYIYPDFSNYQQQLEKANILSNSDLAEVLIKDYNVATLSGDSFGEYRKLTLRMAFSYLDMETEEKSNYFYNTIKNIDSDDDFENKVLELSVNLKLGVDKIINFLNKLNVQY